MTPCSEGKIVAPPGVQGMRKGLGAVRRKDSFNCTPWETRTSAKRWVSTCKVTEEWGSRLWDSSGHCSDAGKAAPPRGPRPCPWSSPTWSSGSSPSVLGAVANGQAPCFSTSTLDFQIRELFFYHLNRALLRSLLFSRAHPHPSFEQSLW